jgi:MFS family permease
MTEQQPDPVAADDAGAPGGVAPPEPLTEPTFASLAVPNYRKFFLGQAVSLAGTWMQSVALAWLVLQLTGSATWLGLNIALQTLPVLLLGPYAGVVVDRVDKRRLLVGTQLTAAVLALVLAVLTLDHRITLGWVLVLSVLLGIVTAFDNPARQAFVREMVPGRLVRNAVTLNSVVVNVSRAVGPAIGGVLIAWLGVGACFAFNAASFLAVVGAYLAMDVAALRTPQPVPHEKGQLRAGFSYVWRTPGLRIPLLMMALVGTLTYEFQVTLPALVTGTFHDGATALGWITSAMGAGAVIGGLVTAGRRATGTRVVAVAAGAFGAATLLLAVMPTVYTAATALLLVGAASIWFLSTGNATLQMTAEPQMRGRVMALWAVAFLGTTPVGGPLVGWVAQEVGPRWALALGGVAALVASAYGRWSHDRSGG